jgi:hypothetical protein
MEIDRNQVALDMFGPQGYPPGFPYENFDVKELILPDGDNMGINSDDDDVDIEEIETESGFGNIIGGQRGMIGAALQPGLQEGRGRDWRPAPGRRRGPARAAAPAGRAPASGAQLRPMGAKPRSAPAGGRAAGRAACGPGGGGYRLHPTAPAAPGSTAAGAERPAAQRWRSSPAGHGRPRSRQPRPAHPGGH